MTVSAGEDTEQPEWSHWEWQMIQIQTMANDIDTLHNALQNSLGLLREIKTYLYLFENV